VIGLAKNHTEENLAGLPTTSLDARQRAAVKAATDMHCPYLNPVSRVLPKAEVVFDKFPLSCNMRPPHSTTCGARSSFAPAP
jgi:transposase